MAHQPTIDSRRLTRLLACLLNEDTSADTLTVPRAVLVDALALAFVHGGELPDDAMVRRAVQHHSQAVLIASQTEQQITEQAVEGFMRVALIAALRGPGA